MPRLFLALAAFALGGLLAVPTFAQDDAAPAAETAKKVPAKPLELAAPEAPSHEYADKDLREFPANALRGGAQSARDDGEPGIAQQLQYWALQADPTRGRFDLACYHALNGDVDGALHWLQDAALEEGVDVDSADVDPDLEDLRADARWTKLRPYLEACAAHWAASGHSRDAVLVPEGYDGKSEIPALIAFHGMGSEPEDFTSDDGDQDLANRLGMAIISLSATECRGRNSWVWSEDVTRDIAHIRKGLERVKDRVKIKPGFAVATGFSQGGQLALEIAARDPDLFAGAISLCAGFMTGSKLDEIEDTSRVRELAVVIIGGSEEGDGNQQLRALDEMFFMGKGARTVSYEYEGMGHAFPPGYYDNMAIWTQTVLAGPIRKMILDQQR